MADAKIFSQEVHRRRVKKFPRRHVVVTGVNEIWSMDLAFMDRLADENKGNKFILCIVDVLSKYAWCVPIKNKSAATVLNALKSVIEKSRRKPQKIWVDKGSEFYNKEFKDWAKSNNITIDATDSESKSVIAESFIKTIKSKIQKYSTETNSRNWVDVSPEIVSITIMCTVQLR